MKEHGCRNGANKSGKSVGGSASYQRKSCPLHNKDTGKNNKSLKEGYVRDDGDWGTTEMRGIEKY